MIERGNPWKPKPTKPLTPPKKETPIERWNLCDSEIPEWLQEFREKVVDDEIPLQGGSHASSSHEASLEPTTKRRQDLGKHSVYTHFPQDRNCEICKRTKITRAPCRGRNGEAVLRALNFGDLITADHKVLSDKLRLSKQSSICSRGAGSSHSMDPGVSVQNQNFTRNPEKIAKVLGTREETKSHLHWQFVGIRACEDLPWNYCTSTPHRSETTGIAERAVRRVKEGTTAVLLQSGLNESWWTDSMECYTYLRNVTNFF